MDQDVSITGKRPRVSGRRYSVSAQPGEALVCHVARSFRVREAALRACGRTTAREALARHVAMYLAHVVLGWEYARVAEIFCRHRTSVRYACARVEDRRDDPRFDARIARLERSILSARDVRR